ncbi:MAG: hypothetical protein COA79_02345 [Planctomycetota bacterium]|nr:MAG: hypothetical protein COA79_02345 [Planctomycetota bacterium]
MKIKLITLLLISPLLFGLSAAQDKDSKAPKKENPKEQPKKNSSDLITANLVNFEISLFLKQIAIEKKINIIFSENVKGKISINLYKVTLNQALKAIIRIYNYKYEKVDDVIYIYTKKEWAEHIKKESPKSVHLYKINYLDISNADNQKLIGEALNPLLDKANNESIRVLPTTHQLLINATDKKHLILKKLIEEIDMAPAQIMVEVLIVDAILTEDLTIGFDYRYLDNIKFGGVSGGNISDTGVNLDPITFSPSTAVSDITTLTPAQANPPFGAARGGNGANFGYVRNHAAAFIDALEAVTDVRVLASPKILAIEGKRAKMIIGKKLGYKTAITTDSITTETVEFLEVGTRLDFICTVAGDYINMDIHPSQSQGSLNAALLPEEITTELETTIRLKDGKTFVIGGLIDERTQTVNSQIPILGSIPILGNLFKRKNQVTNKRELFILITPYIIKNHPDQVVPDTNIQKLKMNATSDSFIYGSNAGRRTKQFKKAQKKYNDGEYLRCAKILKKLRTKYPADASVRILEKLNNDKMKKQKTTEKLKKEK